jgi:membrane-bound inhibitor of C-type lysozyme
MKMVALALLAIVVACAARTAESGFDCAAAKSETIEKFLCSSGELFSLDVELERLLALANGDGEQNVSTEQQKKWSARREACVGEQRTVTASASTSNCARDVYLEQIATLREASQAARAHDAEGISLGPVAFRCRQTDGTLTVTFVNGDVRMAYASLGRRSFIFAQARSGSGARYVGAGDPDQIFWTKGDTAQFRAGAASPEVSCKTVPSG